MSKFLAKHINVKDVLVNSQKWDGGYVMCGLMGHGDAFVLRDPAGIRPDFTTEMMKLLWLPQKEPLSRP